MSYTACIALAVVVVIVSLVCCCCYWFAGKKEGFSALADRNLFVKLKVGRKYQKYYVKNTPDGPPVMVTLVETGSINVPDLFLPLVTKKCLTYAIQFKDGKKNKDGIHVDRGFVKIEQNRLLMDTNSNNHTEFGFYPMDYPHDQSKTRVYIIFALKKPIKSNPIKLGNSIPVLEIV